MCTIPLFGWTNTNIEVMHPGRTVDEQTVCIGFSAKLIY